MIRNAQHVARLALPALGLAALLVWIGSGLLVGERREAAERRALEEGRAAAGERLERAWERGVERRAILALVRAYRVDLEGCDQRRLAEAIHREAEEAEVDPLIVASIVARESSFRSVAVSRAGAVGLMQLRPWVAEDVAFRGAMDWNGHDTLTSPADNVRLGIRYFKELLERFDGDTQLALTAYNYGPTRVSRQVRTGTYAGSGYAERVLSLYAELQELRAAPVEGGGS